MENDEYTREDELDENQNDNAQENQDDNQEQNQSHEEEKDWKAEALKYKAILDRNKGKTQEKATAKPNGVELWSKTILIAQGLKENDERELAFEFAKNTGKPIDEVVDNKYFQQELADFREMKATQNASIRSKGKTSNVAQNDVEFWLTKPFGELPDDFELRKKVVAARRQKSRSTGLFTKD